MQHAFARKTDPGWPRWYCNTHGHFLDSQKDQLICQGGHGVEVKAGIPRFVTGSNYADHFGAQWNKYRVTQLDSYTGEPITRDRIRRCVGDDLYNNLRGKNVLECGCGAGRFTEVLLDAGAKVTSIDLSAAVDANALNFPVDENHRIAQADIGHLPFQQQQFDVVFCLGVIQHTPDPEHTMERLYSHVAPGGALVIDHYAYHIGWYTKTAPLFRAYLKRLPTQKAMQTTERLVDLLLPFHKAAVNKPYPFRVLVHHLSPILSYYTMYPNLNDRLQREWSLLDTHDYLTDWFKYFRTRGQIRGFLQKLGLTDIWCEYGGNGVEARGWRPR